MVIGRSLLHMHHFPLITLLLCAIPGATLAQERDFTFRRPCMGTVWTLKLYAAEEAAANAAAEAAFARVEELNGILSDYLPQSELSRLSATAGTGNAVTVSGDLLTVLLHSQTAAAESGGVFDITIGPGVQIWRKARKSRVLPPPGDILAAREATGWESLVVDAKAKTALLKKPGMRLDTGGIAKGFAQDEAFEVLRAKFQITCAMLDAGGAVAVMGKPPGRAGWNIQLAKTADADPDLVLQVQDTCVATSGDLHQAVEIDGVRYSHIIDKTTGLGMTRPTQVTVVTAKATEADWLATTLCLMGPEKGIEWLAKHHPEAQARITAREGEGAPVVRETGGFASLLKEKAAK